jgi:hypothetical protein
MTPALAENGFSYAEIKPAKKQRIDRLANEIKTKKSLTMSEIQKICAYKSVQAARNLAEDLAFCNPQMFCIIPARGTAKTTTETRRLVLLATE